MSGDDYLLALQLQESFYNSFDDDVPQIIQEPQTDKENKIQKKPKSHKPASSSLVDPSWETIDPTPDIHALFIQFNQTYFWEKLNAVEVRWSPRMTLCAGVCVYQGRAGMCSIRLSLPLLKLRPRKDLVETLLHEMIHAYLFVTHNNRDRDGHGPEFHKHMYRINKEAGTSISVYHSFHDEVKVYQQHWWRCDGPCQKRPPFFGMVRRSMNRAPGPYDNWHADHLATCGGNFIKIREPEGYQDKKKKGKDKAVASISKGGLPNFFPAANGSTGAPKNVVGFGNLSKPSPAPSKPLQGTSVNKVVGFKDLNGGTQPKKNPTNTWSGQGKKLGGTGNSARPDNTGRHGNFGRSGGAGGAMLANRGGGTLVVTGKGKKTENTPQLTDLSTFNPFGGAGHVLGSKSTAKNPSVLLKTPSNSSKTTTSQPKLSNWVSPPAKRPLDSPTSSSKSTKVERDPEVLLLSDDDTPKLKHAMVRCPLCHIEVSEIDVNVHLDECLPRQSDSGKSPDDTACKTEPCPVCNVQVSSTKLESHIASCLSNSLDEDAMNEILGDVKDEEKKDDVKKKCPVCAKLVPSGDLANHLEVCDGMQCSQNSVVLDDESDDEEEEAVGGSPQKNHSGEKLYPCPVCTHLFAESCMNKHLDECMSPK